MGGLGAGLVSVDGPISVDARLEASQALNSLRFPYRDQVAITQYVIELVCCRYGLVINHKNGGLWPSH
jgi:hypothetical protein